MTIEDYIIAMFTALMHSGEYTRTQAIKATARGYKVPVSDVAYIVSGR